MKKILIFVLIAFAGFTFACRKKSDPSPVPYATFKVNGVQKTYYYYSKFCKDFCATSTFCGSFNLHDNILPAELLKIGLPGDPVAGKVFKSGDYRFVFTYVNPSLVWYTYGNLQLTLNRWEGQGGWCSGFFSGVLKSSATDSIIITEGYLQDLIWTYTPEK
ncbi:MAG: hypothetical protein ACOYM0_04215 [Bacteroidales bacterium]